MRRLALGALSVLEATLVTVIALSLACGESGNVAGNTGAGSSAGGDDTGSLPPSDAERPAGWTADTHGNDATPDYAVVFPEAKVNRLDITIAPEDWQAMQDNMTEIYGEPGGGDPIPDGGEQGPFVPGGGGDFGTNGVPPGGVEPAPDEMIEACEGMQEGDTCTSALGAMTLTGTCTSSESGDLACRPEAEWGDRPDGAMPDGGVGLGGGENPSYVPCTVEFEGNTWWYVGIRYKGQSSLSSTWSSGIGKLPLRFDFDEFEDEHPEIDDQRFYGFKELSLASNWSDPSYLREKVAHDIFREAGVPAPRTAFYRVYIDFGEGSTYFGLYTMTEIPDDPMLDAQFGDDSGNLYKPTSNWVSFNEDDFDKETNQDEEDWSDVQAAIAALHADRSDPEAWRAGLEAVFSVDAFLHWLAVNTVIQNWDTYGNMAQNYYLYGDPGDEGRLVWIPWDNNMALSASGGMGGRQDAGGFQDVEDTAGLEDLPDQGGLGRGALSLALDEVGDDWPLIRYLADDPVYWDTYVAYVRETIEGAFAVEPTQARFQAAHDLIAPYVVGTEGEQTGYTFLSDPQEFYTGLDDLLEHVVQRREAALEFLEDAP